MSVISNGRRQKISTEVEQALDTHSQSVNKLKRVLEEEFSRKSAVDDLKAAITAAVNAHHPANTTLCEYCSNLYTFLNRF